MQTKEAYTIWSETYDAVLNKTRDLEQHAQKVLLAGYGWNTCVELGCGTGKNTAWLAKQSSKLMAVDFNEAMIAVAKAKVKLPEVSFIQADIQQSWHFLGDPVDLISCSLILEHIQNLEFIFEQAFTHLNENGLLYMGEFHPFKQYLGSKARFETAEGTVTIEQYTHHFCDYIDCATKAGFQLLQVKEFFHEEDVCLADRMQRSEVSKLAPIVVESPQPKRWHFLKRWQSEDLERIAGSPFTSGSFVPLQIIIVWLENFINLVSL